MNTFLLLRSDVMDIIILLFLIMYGIYCKKGQAIKGNYLLIVFAILGHVIFGTITEITVNMPTVPTKINDILHYFFFIFAIIFSLEYFRYILSILKSKRNVNKIMILMYIIGAIASIFLVCTDIIYIQGDGTAYSAGSGPAVTYGICFVFFSFSNILLIKYHSRIEKNTLLALLPISIVTFIFMLMQIFIPEFLFTENALTFVAIGIFFSVENPVKRVRERSFIDYNTGVYNRNGYENDLPKIIEKAEKKDLGFVICDLNLLKYVNDTYGHMEGDKLILKAASVLQSSLTGAPKLYRIGGDEFAAFYFDNKINNIESEIGLIPNKCKEASESLQAPLEIAVGFARLKEDESVDDMIKRADAVMYANKAELKKLHPDITSR